jgi:hypothetical protein
MKAKRDLVFQYETDDADDAALKPGTFLTMPELTTAPAKNPFGLRISKPEVVDQVVDLFRVFVGQNIRHPNALSTVSKYLRMLDLADLVQVAARVLPESMSLSGEEDAKMKSLLVSILCLPVSAEKSPGKKIKRNIT